MNLFKPSHYVSNRSSAEEILLHYNQLLHVAAKFIFFVVNNTCNSFCSLSCLNKMDIIVIVLAVIVFFLTFKTWLSGPEPKVVSVKCIVARHWSIVGYGFQTFSLFPFRLFHFKPIFLNYCFCDFSIKSDLVTNVKSLNLPRNLF